MFKDNEIKCFISSWPHEKPVEIPLGEINGWLLYRQLLSYLIVESAMSSRAMPPNSSLMDFTVSCWHNNTHGCCDSPLIIPSPRWEKIGEEGRRKRIMQFSFLFLPYLVEFCGNLAETLGPISVILHHGGGQGALRKHHRMHGCRQDPYSTGICHCAMRACSVPIGWSPCHLRCWVF